MSVVNWLIAFFLHPTHTRTMQCPQCQQTKCAAGWTPAQWVKNSPYAEGLDRCKACDAVPRPWLEIAVAIKTVACHLRRVSPEDLHTMEAFIRWFMDPSTTSAMYRKDWSRYGALRAAKPKDPIHFTGPDGQQYFDPDRNINNETIPKRT